MKEHHYQATVTWTGNKGTGTDGYRNYERSHTIDIPHTKLNFTDGNDQACQLFSGMVHQGFCIFNSPFKLTGLIDN